MKFKIKKKVTILRLYHYFFESILLLMTICKNRWNIKPKFKM